MNISENIPEFFVDFIAKIIPGVAIIFIIHLCSDYYIQKQVDLDWFNAHLDSSYNAIAIFVFSYILGSVTYNISLWIDKRLDSKEENKFHEDLAPNNFRVYAPKVRKDIVKTILEECLDEKEKIDSNDVIPCKVPLRSVVAIWWDRIQQENPSEGYKIAKFRAERLMYLNFSIVSILFLFSVICHFGGIYKPIHLLIVCTGIVFIIASIYGYRERRRWYYATVIRMYYNLFIRKGTHNV